MTSHILFLPSILGKIKIFFYEVFKHPLHIMSHPIQGWTDFKNEKKGKIGKERNMMVK